MEKALITAIAKLEELKNDIEDIGHQDMVGEVIHDLSLELDQLQSRHVDQLLAG